MAKRVVIAHGWADDPTRGWIAWLVGQLQQRGIQAAAPQFPDPKRPNIEAWLDTLTDVVQEPDEELVLVGHSLGVPLILRYLNDVDFDGQLAGLVLVAGMGDSPNHRPNRLFDPQLDWERLQTRARRRFCIYSDDDDKVDPAATKQLAEWLGAELVADHGKGHFAGLHGVIELPSVLQAVLSCFE